MSDIPRIEDLEFDGWVCSKSNYPVEEGMLSPPGHHYHENVGDCPDTNLYRTWRERR